MARSSCPGKTAASTTRPRSASSSARKASRVSTSDALDYVFGYTPLLDITLRGEEDRSWRKSMDTFTPIGPYIVTADEVENPEDLDFWLTVNGELAAEVEHLAT